MITITDYNSEKFDVDKLDQMANIILRSLRIADGPWQCLQTFWILYTRVCGEKISRLNFLQQLAKELCPIDQ
jgi:hypothetical protein